MFGGGHVDSRVRFSFDRLTTISGICSPVLMMMDESSSLFELVGCCLKVVSTTTSIRFGAIGEVSVCLVFTNTILLT